jgi:hypothetical protein
LGHSNWWGVFNDRIFGPLTRGGLQILKARSTLNLSHL